jgi:hypothetical protein
VQYAASSKRLWGALRFRRRADSPKRNQRKYYSGKKKRRTLKTRIIINAKTRKITAVFVSYGSCHDFNIWKKSIGVKVVKRVKVQADSGYQGIKKYHGNSETPKKKSKKGRLGKEDKANNRRIGSERIIIEHVNASLKRFHIFVERYHNRRRRFGLCMPLMCGLYNFELGRV